MSDTRMHLTNYSINKGSDAFVQPEDETECEDAHKRTVSSLMRTLQAEGHDVGTLWKQIGEVCVKTIISVQPHLEHTYFTCRGRHLDDAGSGCFELLGFDIMMDHKLRPFLLEVNHSPSFTCDSPLDTAVKSSVLQSTMEMVSFSRDEYKMLRRRGRLTPEARHKLVDLRETYELNNAHRLGFDTLYPPNADTCCGDADAADALLASYDELLAVSKQLHSEMSISGSRRTTSSCGSLAANSHRVGLRGAGAGAATAAGTAARGQPPSPQMSSTTSFTNGGPAAETGHARRPAPSPRHTNGGQLSHRAGTSTQSSTSAPHLARARASSPTLSRTASAASGNGHGSSSARGAARKPPPPEYRVKVVRDHQSRGRHSPPSQPPTKPPPGARHHAPPRAPHHTPNRGKKSRHRSRSPAARASSPALGAARR